MAQGPRILAGLDVGNQRVLALVAELGEHDELVIRGVGVAPSAGMRAGQVVQMKPVVAAIKAAVEEAEFMAKLPVERVLASVAGTFVSGRMTRAAIMLGPREREVTAKDLTQLHAAAQRQPLPPGHTVLNVITHSYMLDDQDGVLDPQDMVGPPARRRRLRARLPGEPRPHAGEGDQRGRARRRGVPLRAGGVGHGHTDRGRTPPGRRSWSTSASATRPSPPSRPRSWSPPAASRSPATRSTTTSCTASRPPRRGRRRSSCAAATMLLTDVGEEETLSVPTIDGRGTPRHLRAAPCARRCASGCRRSSSSSSPT